MMRKAALGKGNRGVLILALFLGLLSAVLVFVYLGQSGGGDEEAAPSGETKAVVVASKDIAAGTRITEDMVRVKNVSSDSAVPNAFSTTELVVGSVARFPISADEQILENRLAAGIAVPTGDDVPLTYIVPEGMRAVALNTKQVISAGGLVLPGDYVDIIFVAGVRTDLPPPLDLAHISQTVLQNLEVLAVEQTIEEVVPEGTGDGDGAGDGADGVDGGNGEVSQRVAVDRPDPDPEAITVTLAVTPQQAEVLAMADVIAKASDNDTTDIRLSLRRFGDQEQSTVNAMTDFELVSVEMLQSLIRTMQQLAGPLKELKAMAED